MPSMKSNIGNPKIISLDDICTLVSKTTTGKDELGQPILEEKYYMVFCSKLSITRGEHAIAGQLGFKPDMLLIVDSDSYDDEKYVDYYGKRFTIYKSFMRIDGFTEIYCEVDVGNDRN
jgi:SPP1 family predicted phage head-tail adaptor